MPVVMMRERGIISHWDLGFGGSCHESHTQQKSSVTTSPKKKVKKLVS